MLVGEGQEDDALTPQLQCEEVSVEAIGPGRRLLHETRRRVLVAWSKVAAQSQRETVGSQKYLGQQRTLWGTFSLSLYLSSEHA